MDKGYYIISNRTGDTRHNQSQSTIKMDKGYYCIYKWSYTIINDTVAIHNKNGQGLLHTRYVMGMGKR